MYVVLWIAWVAAVSSYLAGPVMDPDLWWHITSGRWILAHHAVPHVDYWNRFAAGTPWRAYSWSNEILFALTDRYFGDRGLMLLQKLVCAGIVAIYAVVLSKMARDWFLGTLLGSFAAIACFNHYTLRPQSFVWIYLAVLVLLAQRIETEGLTRRLKLQLAGLMCLWANTHLTAALGIAVLGAWLVEFARGETERISPKNWRMIKALGWAFLGTLFTPYFGTEWLTFFAKTGHPLHYTLIAEFQPATILMYSTGFLVIPLVVLGIFVLHRPRALEGGKYALVAIFAVGGLAVIKFLPLSVFLACAAIAEIWRRIESDRSVIGELAGAVEYYRGLLAKVPREGLSFVLLALAFVYSFDDYAKPLHGGVVPVEAVDFIKEHDLPDPLLNDFGSGGYLMYRFSDEAGAPLRLVSIDGRTNVNPPEVWDRFRDAFEGKVEWEDYITYVKPGTILWKRQSPFFPLLIQSNEWCGVFLSGDDELGHAVFIRASQWEGLRTKLASFDCPGPLDWSSAPGNLSKERRDKREGAAT